MTTQYVVVSGTVARGHTLYGPFPSVEAAHEWAARPERASETRERFEVLPLFGGLMIEPERKRCRFCTTSGCPENLLDAQGVCMCCREAVAS